MATSGSYEQLEGRPVVSFERTFPHPVAEVWAAVTDPARLAEWFPTTLEFAALEAGEPIEFHFAEDRYPPMRGAFLEVSPPARLAFTWGEDELTFELAERDGGAGCRLRLRVVLDAAGKAARDSAGWETCLDRLAAVAGGGAPDEAVDPERWKRYYEEYKAAGLPATAPIPE